MKVRGLLLVAGVALSVLPVQALAAGTSDPTTTTTIAPATTTASATTTTSTTTTAAPGSDGQRNTSPSNPAPPVRGTTAQVTPTLPPPTTTTTIPPELVLPANSGAGRRVVYSNSAMRVWAVEADGTVAKTHRVSGKQFVPAPGTYSVFSRSLYTYSRTHPNITWMYMVRFAHSASGDNIGFHEIPTKCENGACWKLQTEAQLGQPLSGGCVRQSTPDAIWMWNWAGLGTTVVVLP